MYCISCGTKGARWPKHAPMTCTMHCAAIRVLGEYNTDSDGFFCPDCGQEAASYHCGASEQAAEDKRENWMDRLLRRSR